MSTYEIISLMIAFSMFTLTLISLIVVLLRITTKGKK